MNPKEIEAYWKLAAWLKEDADESSMLTEENIKRIFLAVSVLPDMLAHIDSQAKQIATLTAACVHSEAKGMMLQHNEWSQDIKDLSDFVEDAKKQLARDMPDIFKEDMK
jgi:hypothetical protein